ncbi:hypothetical protein [Kytococcus sp. HMSC28H12]|uniref:hypothetical protein n=1 Tax=Kytococcus sp. HMSC28H12 TaxID=1581067 RepID=UPI0008A616CE|nr:hypothetical protein [Kytococcus sp. HMSC28H12]OFS14458.1 hypothetical protein HMPREF3099_04130 [Kytococcus sp. HMSC28H12]
MSTPPTLGAPDWESRTTDPQRIQTGPVDGSHPMADAAPSAPRSSGGRGSSGGPDRTTLGCLLGGGLVALLLVVAGFWLFGGLDEDRPEDAGPGDAAQATPTLPDAPSAPAVPSGGALPSTPAMPSMPSVPAVESAAPVGFGEKATVHGVEVVVGEPQSFTPSETAAGFSPDAHPVVQEVTVTNHGEKPFEVSFLTFRATAGGEDVRRGFDFGQDLGQPSGAVEPGGSTTFRIGWSVEDTEDLTVTGSVVTPDGGRGTSTWER